MPPSPFSADFSSSLFIPLVNANMSFHFWPSPWFLASESSPWFRAALLRRLRPEPFSNLQVILLLLSTRLCAARDGYFASFCLFIFRCEFDEGSFRGNFCFQRRRISINFRLRERNELKFNNLSVSIACLVTFIITEY